MDLKIRFRVHAWAAKREAGLYQELEVIEAKRPHQSIPWPQKPLIRPLARP